MTPVFNDLSYLTKGRYIPTRHGIFKFFNLDCTSEYEYSNLEFVILQEKLSSSSDLVIVPFGVGSAIYYCIGANHESVLKAKTFLEQSYVVDINVFEYNDVCISCKEGVIFSDNQDYISLLYILLKNRQLYNHEFKIHDLCIYHDKTLKVGVICGISDNANKETIYNVKPIKDGNVKKTFNHSEVAPCSKFGKYFNLPDTTDIFYMDFDAEVDEGMFFCGF